VGQVPTRPAGARFGKASYNRSGNEENSMFDKIVGRGLSFPVRLSDRDRLSMVEGDADIREAIRIIIMTVPGERVMRPDYGCYIHDLIFHPANYQTATLAEQYVREALEKWEPRITLEEINVTPGGAEYGELLIEIHYQLKNQSSPQSMVYPFYLVPDETKEE
jgi:hypothetical protein